VTSFCDLSLNLKTLRPYQEYSIFILNFLLTKRIKNGNQVQEIDITVAMPLPSIIECPLHNFSKIKSILYVPSGKRMLPLLPVDHLSEKILIRFWTSKYQNPAAILKT
jgi:hypothetical protein